MPTYDKIMKKYAVLIAIICVLLTACTGSSEAIKPYNSMSTIPAALVGTWQLASRPYSTEELIRSDNKIEVREIDSGKTRRIDDYKIINIDNDHSAYLIRSFNHKPPQETEFQFMHLSFNERTDTLEWTYLCYTDIIEWNEGIDIIRKRLTSPQDYNCLVQITEPRTNTHAYKRAQ